VCCLKRAANQWTTFYAWATTGIKLSSLPAKERTAEASPLIAPVQPQVVAPAEQAQREEHAGPLAQQEDAEKQAEGAKEAEHAKEAEAERHGETAGKTETLQNAYFAYMAVKDCVKKGYLGADAETKAKEGMTRTEKEELSKNATLDPQKLWDAVGKQFQFVVSMSNIVENVGGLDQMLTMRRYVASRTWFLTCLRLFPKCPKRISNPS
jgi:hypothetical protein